MAKHEKEQTDWERIHSEKADPEKKPKRDTSVDWITVPRLSVFFIVALIVTVYFHI